MNDNNGQAASALSNAEDCAARGHYDDAVRALINIKSRTFVSANVKCMELLALIACRKKRDHMDSLISEIRKLKSRFSSLPEAEKSAEAVVEVVLSNVRAMLEEANANIKQTMSNPSPKDEEFSLITGVPLDVRVKERFLSPCMTIVNRLATEFFNFGNFLSTSRSMLRVYCATVLHFVSLCTEYELDKTLDRVADSVTRTLQRVFLDPIPPLQPKTSSYNRHNVLVEEIIRNRRDFFASNSAGEEMIDMLSEVATKLSKRNCWRHLWTVVMCMHKISQGFDSSSIKTASYACAASVFWTCNRWDYHAYCLSRAAQMDPATYATAAALAALCTHDNDKQYDPFETNTGININAAISAVFDDPETDNEALLARLLVPGIMKCIESSALNFVNQLRKIPLQNDLTHDYHMINKKLSELMDSSSSLSKYEKLLRETILRRQVEDIAQRNNLVEVHQLAMANAASMSDAEYVHFVEPVILQDTGVPVDIDCKNRTIAFRNSARKKLHSCFTKIASMVSVKPAAPSVNVKDNQGLIHTLPLPTPSVSVEDLKHSYERYKSFRMLQEACRNTKEKRKEQRQNKIKEEKEKNKEERMLRERQKQEQHRKARAAVALAEMRDKARKQGLLNVIKIFRSKYPGIQIDESIASKTVTGFEDDLTQILADFKRRKAESSQKEHLDQNLLERTLRRMDIPKRKEFNEHNAELHKAERAAAKENFLAQHRKEYEKRQKERAVLQTFQRDAEVFEREVIMRSIGEKSSRRDEQQSLIEQEMRRLANQ